MTATEIGTAPADPGFTANYARIVRAAARIACAAPGRRSRRQRREAGQKARLTQTPEEHQVIAEERELVRRTPAALDSKQAELLLLRFHGLSYAELATTLHLKTASVGTLLRALESADDWNPEPAAAWARLEQRRRRRSVWAALSVAVAAVILIAIQTPARCAITTAGCPRLLPAAAAAHNSAGDYKVTGSPTAPITIEIYSDYECPYRVVFYKNVYPQLDAGFVDTGNVRIIHRDFPPPQHPHSKLAVSYANAAGETGHYNEAVAQLFKTQDQWAADGHINAALAQVFSPGEMEKIRSRLADPALDRTFATDLAAVAANHIDHSPNLVLIYKGKRQVMTAPDSYGLLRRYLDELLAH